MRKARPLPGGIASCLPFTEEPGQPEALGDCYPLGGAHSQRHPGNVPLIWPPSQLSHKPSPGWAGCREPATGRGLLCPITAARCLLGTGEDMCPAACSSSSLRVLGALSPHQALSAQLSLGRSVLSTLSPDSADPGPTNMRPVVSSHSQEFMELPVSQQHRGLLTISLCI